MRFCTDTDLLHWEPDLFREAAVASQTLLAGAGDLDGTAFTLDVGAGSLIDARVAQHHVLAITSGAKAGCYPIVSVDGSAELTISALHGELYPTEGDPQPVPIGQTSDVTFAIRSFAPQAQVVSEMIRAAAGLRPADAGDVWTILNPACLRRPCVLGTLQMIYSALAAAAAEEDAAPLSVRADLYERLYRRALRAARVSIDTNGDGAEDIARGLNVLKLQRA